MTRRFIRERQAEAAPSQSDEISYNGPAARRRARGAAIWAPRPSDVDARPGASVPVRAGLAHPWHTGDLQRCTGRRRILGIRCNSRSVNGGRCRIRTCEPCRVNRREVVGRPAPVLSSPRNHWRWQRRAITTFGTIWHRFSRGWVQIGSNVPAQSSFPAGVLGRPCFPSAKSPSSCT